MLIIKLLIKTYQIFISPLLPIIVGGGCRHRPTCSQYAYYAVDRYGLRGLMLALKRILQCNPWS